MNSYGADYRTAVAAAQTFVTAARRKDGLLLDNWKRQSETQLSEFPEVSYCTASDGVPFNCKGSVFHPDTLRSILDAVNVPVFDVDINTDLLHINGPLCGIFPAALHPGSTEEQMNTVKGKTSLLVPSGGAKFGLEDPVIHQFQQWSSLMKGWLSQKTSPDTVIVLVLPVRVNTVDSALSYSLDRRVFLLALRRWVTTAALVENPQRLRYNGVTEEPLLIEQDESSLLIVKLSSAAKFQDVRVVQRSLQSDAPVNHLFPPPKIKSVHVRFDCPTSTANSNMELFKVMNMVDVDTRSSVLKGMDLQFCGEHLPAKVQYGSPDNYAVFDYFASPEEYNALEENREQYQDGEVNFGIVQVQASFLASHMSVGKTRKQSPELRDSISFMPSIVRRLSTMIVWSKFDLLISVKSMDDVQWLAADLWEHDRIVLTDLQSNQRVFGARGSVHAPKILMSYPVTLVHESILAYAGRFGTVMSVAPAGKVGQSVITFENPESSHLAAGVSVPVLGLGNIKFTTGCAQRDKEYAGLLPQTAVQSLDSRCLHAKQFVKLSASALAQVNELEDHPMEDVPPEVNANTPNKRKKTRASPKA